MEYGKWRVEVSLAISGKRVGVGFFEDCSTPSVSVGGKSYSPADLIEREPIHLSPANEPRPDRPNLPDTPESFAPPGPADGDDEAYGQAKRDAYEAILRWQMMVAAATDPYMTTDPDEQDHRLRRLGLR